MKYEFETKLGNYSDLASGTVLRSAPGHPAFPVRLASELFQRAYAIWALGRKPGEDCTLYDPFCGAAYSLVVLKLLHWNSITHLVGSDIDPEAIALADLNLALLRPEHLRARAAKIASRALEFRKPSHAAALESASRLLAHVQRLSKTCPASTSLFLADALKPNDTAIGLAGRLPSIIFADVPYGASTQWIRETGSSDQDTMLRFFRAASMVTSRGAVVIAITPRTFGRFHPDGYYPVAFLKGKGHRQVNILRRTD